MEKELSLLEIFKVLRKRIVTLMLVIFIFIVTGLGIGLYLNKSVYTSTSSVLIGSEAERETNEYNNLTGEPLKETYIRYGKDRITEESSEFYKELLKSNALLENVIHDLNLDITIKELKKQISIEIPENSSMIKISTVSHNLQQVDEITNQIVEELKNKNTEITGLENIEILNSASKPKVENTVDLILYLLLSIFFGTIVALIMVLLLEYLDKSIQTEKNIEEIDLPVLGSISKETFTEDLKNIRTKMLYSSKYIDKKVVTITSASESQSEIAIKLAELFAENSQKTILIDGNFRESSIHNKLHLKNDIGLSNALTEENIELDTIIKNQGKNYSIITAGSELAYSTEKLSNLNMKKIISKLSRKYSYIFIQGYPIGELTDSVALSTLTDGVILQVEAHKTHIDELLKAKKILTEIDIDILGVILINK